MPPSADGHVLDSTAWWPTFPALPEPQPERPGDRYHFTSLSHRNGATSRAGRSRVCPGPSETWHWYSALLRILRDKPYH